ncbi:hypothetical protein HYH03_004211 [Edaphochlamys debaryana]|uniref:Nucleoside phosphorylase domain-containing protein n=1 Tax=Edaphochlamys debaryana TaxID=47281 RepID=A0A836C3R0_9CHLO|nr:hypothetical protein HYH03_004211 [Edaphochlamys debaryana]|eukprot:KAG2497949.1 hypothetical protein HYH03_004211 [Edaphochlamys debaryana]
MDAEAKPLIQALDLKEDTPPKIVGPAPCVTFSGVHDGLHIHVVWNGKDRETGVDNVGTVPAALSTYLSVLAFQPDVVISAGTAGGFKAQGAAIGDVFLGSAVINHDRRIPLPNFDKYGIGYSNCLATPNLQSSLGLKQGVVSSGNSLDYTDKCMEIMAQHSVAVKEMEAAAIAWACNLYHVPLMCVKAVTDIVDGDRATAEEFLENLHAAAAALQGTVPKVLTAMAGKRMDEL